MNTILKRHLDAIQSGKVTRTNVIGLRKMLNTCARAMAGYSTSATAPRVTTDDLDKLEAALTANRPEVVGELHESGVRLLTSPRYRKRLTPVADIIADLQWFRLVNFDWIDRYHSVPVYEAVARDGRSFTFRNIPWQSGGEGPEVLTVPALQGA